MPHEPKKRHSRARQGKRRASIRLQIPGIVACPNCKEKVYPHTVCRKCGYYGSKQVIKVKEQAKIQVRKAQSAK